jgi:SNF2 family DNA or RNA helicase
MLQTKPIEVIRFICSNSIEEQILALQEKKRSLTQIALGKTEKTERNVKLEDLKQLFQLKIEKLNE